jgi:YD repeat-containing protein
VRYEYDADGNVLTTYGARAFAGGSTPDTAYATRTEYDRIGRPVTRYVPRVDPDTPPPSLVDAAGQPVTTQSDECPTGIAGYPAGARVCIGRTEYDLAGRVSRSWLPTAGGTTTGPRHVDHVYTHDGLLWKTTAPAPAGNGVATVTTKRYYDAEQQLVKYLDTRNLPTTYEYTGDHLLEQVTAPANGTLTHTASMTYDTNGNVLTKTGFAGVTRSFAYFADDRLQKTWTPNDRAATATVSAYDPAGDVRSYVYDGVGNVTKVFSPVANAVGTSYQDGAATAKVPTVNTYSWDNLLLTSVAPVSPDGRTKLRRTTFAYDDPGRQTEQRIEYVSDTAANAGSYTVTSASPDLQTLSYYPNGRLERRTGDNGTSFIEYAYDPDGNQVSATTGITDDLVTATYYADGRLATVDAGSRRTAYLYDGGGHVVARADAALTGGTPGTYSATSYRFDDSGLPDRMRSPVSVHSVHAAPGKATSVGELWRAAGATVAPYPGT